MPALLVAPFPSDLVVTERLHERFPRIPDVRVENVALNALAREFADPSANVFQSVAATAMQLCRAHSSGISLIEQDGAETIFRWIAVCGAWAKYSGGSLPRDASPCGVVVDTRSWHLMARPAAYFPRMKDADPPVVEVLLIPFHVLGETVGTVWVISHDDEIRFDAEDLRLMEGMADFAGAAYLTRHRLSLDTEAREELSRSNARLRASNEKLSDRLANSARTDETSRNTIGANP